ncbi:MAG: peptidoglycan DD-metalloendopeptidase family protein [Arcobacteraceae bacterium]
MKIFLALFFITSALNASIAEINNKIDQNKEQIKSVQQRKSNINKNINLLADTINKEEEAYKKVVEILKSTNTKLLLNRLKLSSAQTKVSELTVKSKQLQEAKTKMEQDVIDFVIEKYSMSMGIEQVNKKHINDIVNKELYTLVFDNTRQEILNLNIQYLKINSSIRENEKKIANLSDYIKEQNDVKVRYIGLEKVQEKTLESLKKKHKIYQENLKELISKQNQITDLLGSLNILKKKEIEAEEERIRKAKEIARKKEEERQRKLKEEAEAKKRALLKETKKSKEIKIKKRDDFDKEIDIEVKKIGSSAKGVKISKYYGSTTIAPLKSYEITKRFGKYYDAVYKMELFNESVALKTKIPNAKVFSVFKGQVVYAKQNSGLLENVVIVKHKNNLHTIYSHLDQISPTLKAGKWIPKGYVVGRVSDTLEFQATKNSKYIDPLKLIKGIK